MSLIIAPVKSYYEAGSNITLSFCVTEPTLSLIDINTTVDIMWLSHKNLSSHFFSQNFNELFDYTINNSKLSDAGEYYCTYYLTSTNRNPYIKQGIPITKITNITLKSKYTNLFFLLNFIFYPSP